MSNGYFLIAQVIQASVLGIEHALAKDDVKNCKKYIKQLRDLADELARPSSEGMCKHPHTKREGSFYERCLDCGKTKADDEEIWRD